MEKKKREYDEGIIWRENVVEVWIQISILALDQDKSH